MLEKLLDIGRKVIPGPLFRMWQPVYHWLWALVSALIYRFPARKLTVVVITGTKGKTTTAELLHNILNAAGYKTSLTSTTSFAIGREKERNKLHMGLPGRTFIQSHLRQSVDAGCTHAIVEIGSEATVQFRHKFLSPDGLIFTGIHPEHIESHGSFRNYLEAKLALARALEASSKNNRIVVANADDDKAHMFLDIDVEQRLGVHLDMAQPYVCETRESKLTFRRTEIRTKLPGEFNIRNIQLAAAMAQALGVSVESIKSGVESLESVEGRMNFIENKRGFDVVVDYAHTTGSLEAVYKAFEGKRKVCVLGCMGGGRDTWKRPEMGAIADKYCDKIILTNEDPVDENPRAIVDAMAEGITDKSKLTIEMDRRKAIGLALKSAEQGDAVLITGKGSDPFIWGPNGQKTPWSDKGVAQEELGKIDNI